MKNVFALIAVAGLAGAAQAGIWSEVGDAGDLLLTAQNTSGSGGLTSITGAFLASDTDLYMIKITDPAAFSAITTIGGDTQLWLFSMAAGGIATNDDAVGAFSRIRGIDVIASGTTIGLTVASQLVAGECYLLGVSAYNRDARNGGGVAMFANTFSGVHGPVAAAGTLTSWTGATTARAYSIDLIGADYCIPAPGAAALLGLGGLLVARRRR